MKYPEISKRFNYIMNLRGIKQVDLVNKSGFSKASINQYVNGIACPGNGRAMVLAKILNVNPLWLMGFDVDMTAPIDATLEKKRKEREEHFVNLFAQLTDDQQILVNNMISAFLSK